MFRSRDGWEYMNSRQDIEHTEISLWFSMCGTKEKEVEK